MRAASRTDICLMTFSVPPSRSARPSTSPIAISIVAISHRLRSSLSIVSLKNTPSTTIGSEPTMMNQPMRASRWPRYSGLKRASTQARAILQMSLRK